jgi:hypothetical protein
MRARDWKCPFTGRTADHLHHAFGRDALGEYFFPSVEVPLGQRLHVVQHQLWGIDGIADGTDADPVVLCLGRGGRLCVHLGEHHDDTATVELPAVFVREFGRALQQLANDIEERT